VIYKVNDKQNPIKERQGATRQTKSRFTLLITIPKYNISLLNVKNCNHFTMISGQFISLTFKNTMDFNSET